MKSATSYLRALLPVNATNIIKMPTIFEKLRNFTAKIANISLYETALSFNRTLYICSYWLQEKPTGYLQRTEIGRGAYL